MDLRKDKSTKTVDRRSAEAVATDVSNGIYMECSALTQVYWYLLVIYWRVSELQFSCPYFNHSYFSIIQEGLKDIFERAVEVVTKGKNSKEENPGGCFPKAISHSFRNCSIL